MSLFWIWSVFGRWLYLKDLFTHFKDFLSQIWVVILVTPNEEVEWKSELSLILKQSLKTVVEQKFAFSLVVFRSHAALSTLIFIVFCISWIGFLLNDFFNPFEIHLGLIFVWIKFPFLARAFLFTCDISTLIFSSILCLIFLQLVFPIHLQPTGFW